MYAGTRKGTKFSERQQTGGEHAVFETKHQEVDGRYTARIPRYCSKGPNYMAAKKTERRSVDEHDQASEVGDADG